MKKIVILGAGNVGATIAYTLTLEDMASEIVLIDINADKARGEAMDIAQGIAFNPPICIYAGTYEDARDADLVIVTLGMARKPGQSRIDLAQANVNIVKSVMPQLVRYAPDAVYLVVSNPVDVLTYAIQKCTGLPETRVFGSGTILDTARLRARIADSVNVNPQNVHAYVLGEHGDTSVIPWSIAMIGGVRIEDFHPFPEPKDKAGIDKEAIESDVRTSGAKVIGYKGATYYAIALSVRRICEYLTRESQTLISVSSLIHGQYGIDDVSLSLPFALNDRGVSYSVNLSLTPDEENRLRASADALKTVIKSLDI